MFSFVADGNVNHLNGPMKSSRSEQNLFLIFLRTSLQGTGSDKKLSTLRIVGEERRCGSGVKNHLTSVSVVSCDVA